jgi:hypothetical protein
VSGPVVDLLNVQKVDQEPFVIRRRSLSTRASREQSRRVNRRETVAGVGAGPVPAFGLGHLTPLLQQVPEVGHRETVAGVGFKELVDNELLDLERRPAPQTAFDERYRARNTYRVIPNGLTRINRARPSTALDDFNDFNDSDGLDSSGAAITASDLWGDPD